MSYKIGQKVRLLKNRKIVTITKINKDGVPIEGISEGVIIDLVQNVFVLVRLLEVIFNIFKSLFSR